MVVLSPRLRLLCLEIDHAAGRVKMLAAGAASSAAGVTKSRGGATSPVSHP